MSGTAIGNAAVLCAVLTCRMVPFVCTLATRVVSGTDMPYAAIGLLAYYVVPGTNVPYRIPFFSYGTRFAVLTQSMLLPEIEVLRQKVAEAKSAFQVSQLAAKSNPNSHGLRTVCVRPWVYCT